MANSIKAPVTIIRNSVTAPVMLARDAYQLAVLEGFTGTRAQWIESLEGAAGPAGADGADGADGASVIVSATAPPLPIGPGQQWLDTTDGVLSTWDALQGVWVTTGESVGTVTDIPALAFTYQGQPYTYQGAYFTAPP